MIKKLELKHFNIGDEVYGASDIWAIKSLHDSNALTISNGKDIQTLSIDDFKIDYSLIKRPLSDLWSDSVIEKDRDKLSQWDIERIQETITCIPMGLIHTSLVDKLSFETVQFLISKHYDIFGLIEKGLAININTL